jgi:hypothetical protein
LFFWYKNGATISSANQLSEVEPVAEKSKTATPAPAKKKK